MQTILLWFFLINGLYMFRTFTCPSSGVLICRLFYCHMWCYAISVEAVVLQSWCVVLCTVYQLVSNKLEASDAFPAHKCYVKCTVVPRQAEVAQGVPASLRPRIILTFRHYKGGRSSAIRTGRLYSKRNPWYSFSVAESTPGHMVPSGGATEKIPSGITGNRSRDRQTSSTVP